jgi:hypothetical protein
MSGEFHAELSRKADQPVLDALAGEVERCSAELSRCAAQEGSFGVRRS